MQPEPGRPSDPRGDALLPPATTRWQPLPDADDEAAMPLAPFLPGRPEAAAASPAPAEAPMPWEEAPLEPEPEAPALLDLEPEPVLLDLEPEPAALDLEPEPLDLEAEPAALDLEPEPDPLAWLTEPPEPVEPAGDTGSDFPLDAFFIPEEADAMAVEGAAGADGEELAAALADRLEALAAELRESGFEALFRADHRGGPDDILAALISGYLAARAR